MAHSRTPAPEPRLLTEAELELMSVLWEHGPSTVREVLAALPPGREPAYTTVSTILRILEQKGFVESRKEGRGHVYAPLVAKPDYEARSASHLVSRVFDGQPAALVRRLFEAGSFTREDLEELRILLERRED